MRRLAVVLAVLPMLCGCGGGGSKVVSCADRFRDGASTDAVVAASDQGPCNDEAGEQTLVASLIYDCDDGRELKSNDDYGWGFSGGRWHAPADAAAVSEQLFTVCKPG